MGAAVARTLEDLGADHVRLQADLRVTGRSLEALCMERLMVGVVGLAMALVPGSVLWAAGLGLPLGAWIGGAVLLGVGGFFLPVATLHSVAEERRRSFRYAFSAFLDLTAVSLSSGAGVEEALAYSARAGEGWAFAEITHAIDSARRTGETPWVVLRRFGDDIGVGEVSELAATLSLAGTEGARARDTLLAKAASLRRQRLAETEAEANRRIETARLPLVLQFLGFATLVMAPALFQVVASLR
ncbi:MAG: type II secretion system F family protein, partial [Acidimicrobiales bacterium]